MMQTEKLNYCSFLFSDQNRNKTSKSKTTVKAVKPAEPVPADIHSKEVQRLEALCEERTKQLKMVQLHLQNSNTAFDGMSTVVKYLAHDVSIKVEFFLILSLFIFYTVS